MATVTKNFRIKSGLIVEGTTGTINGQNILTETGGDSYILNLVGGATLVKSVDTGVFNVDGSGNLTVNANTFDSYGSASAAQTAAETTAALDATAKANAAQLAAETTAALDATSKANAAQTAAQSYADGLASNYDAAGSASAAQTAAQSYADGLASNYDAAGSASAAQLAAQSYADGLASNYDAAGAAATAEQNAKDYADDLINDASSSSAEVWSAYKTSTEIGLAQAAAELHADNAVANLVGSAPAVLDTIQELATALENNPDIIADLENVAAGKQDTLTAGSNIDITGTTISVTGLDSADISDFNTAALSATSAAYDAAGAAAAAQTAAEGFATTAANNAQSAAESYADGLASNYDSAGSASAAQYAAEGHADGLADDILDGTSAFTEINVNDLVSQRAAQGLVATAQNGSSMMSWAKADYGTAKAWVKFATATHSQISEFLLTTDSSGNVAITEFGMVTSNGILGSVDASYLNGNIAIEVDTVHANTTVTVVATLIK